MTQAQAHVLIDASIAQSANHPARHPTNVACMSLVRLLEDRASKSAPAMTPSLQEEWRQHATAFMVSWLARMESRGRLRREPDVRVNDLRSAIEGVSEEGIKTALLKDVHLSEAAIWHGFIVASRDDRQRRYLGEVVANSYELAGKIQWVNPVVDSDWEIWVSEGCEDASAFNCAPDS